MEETEYTAAQGPLLRKLQDWAASRPEIVGLLLVGSHARGAARSDSDVDIMVLVDDPLPFFRDRSWLAVFGQSLSSAEELWGNVRTMRATFGNGPEIEFNFASPNWARLPIEDGAKRVIEDGVRVLFDRTGELKHLSRRPSV